AGVYGGGAGGGGRARLQLRQGHRDCDPGWLYELVLRLRVGCWQADRGAGQDGADRRRQVGPMGEPTGADRRAVGWVPDEYRLVCNPDRAERVGEAVLWATGGQSYAGGEHLRGHAGRL